MRDRAWVRLDAEDLVFEFADYEIEHVGHDDGEVHSIELTVGREGLAVTIDIPLEEADEFLVAFRDEVVRAKQAKLAWETCTDPSSGVVDEGGASES